MEVCKILEQMGFAVYAVGDPRATDLGEERQMSPEKKKIRKPLVNWDREMKILMKQGK
jgi:hypothetical protein